jgi:anti-sigma factor ChrR (cupin superfamily)
MAPGCGYPAHRHLDVEEVLILAGGYRDELGDHRAGDYLRYPPGSEHAPVALGDATRPAGPGNEACLLFASARGGVLNLPEDALRPRAGPSPRAE